MTITVSSSDPISTIVRLAAVLGLFFTLSTPWLALTLLVAVSGAVAVGAVFGRWLRERAPDRHGSIGVVQGALFGLIGLLLAFGLSMAVGRYDNRRAATVEAANSIETAVLLARLLDEPDRSSSLELMSRYAEIAVRFSGSAPGSAAFTSMSDALGEVFDELWVIAGAIAAQDRTATLPPLYLEALIAMNGDHIEREAVLGSRIPDEVMVLLVVAVMLTLGVLGAHLNVVGRGVLSPLAAGAVVVAIVFVILDLDRPHRGLITIPDSAIVEVQARLDD